MGERQTGGAKGAMEQELETLPKKRRGSKQNEDVGANVSRQTGRNAEWSDSSEGVECVSDDNNLSHSQGQASHRGYTAKMIKYDGSHPAKLFS